VGAAPASLYVCPFVPGSLERKTLWLAPEQIADRDVPKVVELMSGYKRLLLDTRPTEGDDVIYNVIVVVFTDLSADRAQGVFGDVLQQLAVPSYVEDGILFGPYYEGNKGTAIFQSPVPFLFVRHGVTGATTRSHREPIRAAIESMNGARFVHDRLDLAGWQVETADAQKVKGSRW
jgi:hypothetical protein